MKPENRVRHRSEFSICLLIVATLTAGCAGQGKYARFQPVPRDTVLSVVALEPEITVPDAKTAGETVALATAGGAGGGFLAGLGGGIYLSALCGPAIIVCAPVLVPTGAAVGLVGGTALGADTAASKALPKEKAEALEAVMSDAISEIVFSAALHDEFVQRSADRWILSHDSKATKLTLGIETLNLTQLENDVLALNFTASMILQYDPEDGQPTRRFLFSHRSDARHVDDFLDDGELFRGLIKAAVRETIDDMVNALDYTSTRNTAR